MLGLWATRASSPSEVRILRPSFARSLSLHRSGELVATRRLSGRIGELFRVNDNHCQTAKSSLVALLDGNTGPASNKDMSIF